MALFFNFADILLKEIIVEKMNIEIFGTCSSLHYKLFYAGYIGIDTRGRLFQFLAKLIRSLFLFVSWSFHLKFGF